MLPWHMMVRRSASIQWSKRIQREFSTWKAVFIDRTFALTKVAVNVLGLRLRQIAKVSFWI